MICPSVSAGSTEDPVTVHDSLITKIDQDTYAVGGVRISKSTREITVPGAVNMQQGQVEYFATTRRGKTHEAVLVLDCQPLDLQTALLLLGFECGEANMRYQGDSIPPQGDSLAVMVRWTDADGREVVHPAYELVYDRPHETTMRPTPWLFTGSMVVDGRFIADLDGSIIATYSDPAAVLNNPLSGRLDDTVYEANAALLPEPGAEVTVTIAAWTPSTTTEE